MKKIAVIIPCYNEAKSIANVIRKFPNKDTLARHGFNVKIFVVDNNSNDDTAKIAKKAGATILFEPKKGKGKALRTGFANIPKDIDYIVMIDGDDQYNSQELLNIVKPLNNIADVIIGSRFDGKIYNNSIASLNLIGNRFFTRLVRLFYKTKITDVLSGYYACKKTVIDQLYPYLVSDGFAIEMEIITKIIRSDYKITSVPITCSPRIGKSNLKPIRDGARIMYTLLQNLNWKPKK
jgi:glycosyltransferase involved in cell wall biosynthesis